jgi:hypothetical protein
MVRAATASPSALMRSGHNGAATRCDPKRRELIGIFEQWWTSHGDLLLKGQELDHEVIKLIPDAITRDGIVSRQKVACFLAAHDGTRVGGYVLSKTMHGPPSKQVAHYKLAYRPEEHR